MKIFAPALKRQMKDCILSIFWPKKEIYAFFKDCSVPKGTIENIDKWDDRGLSRSDMVDIVFDALSDQPDNGTLHLNLILDTLADWTHFDDYWFKNQQKLDLENAKKKISILKVSKEKSVDKAKKRAAKLKTEKAAREKRYNSLDEMRQDFQTLSFNSETSQKRGYAFEKFLTKMARFYELKVTEAFKIKGTQIDGTIKYDGENYSIEAKWHDRQLSDEPLLSFCRKQEINMHGRGIFISINGFTEGALSMLERGSVKNTVLMDGEDIALILNEMVSLPEALEKKIHAAQTRGEFYINPITGENKLKT